MPDAMRLRDVIRAEKRNIKPGGWKEDPIPRGEFALRRRNGPYRTPPGSKWRVLEFDALDERFVVLVLFSPLKGVYRATLGRVVGRDMVILCSYEYHATEPGWHCHAACGPTSHLPVCVQRGPWVRRIPKEGARHNRQEFNVSEQNALTIAADFYRVARGSLL